MSKQTRRTDKKIGPFYLYPMLKRDLMITVGLIILLVVIKAIG